MIDTLVTLPRSCARDVQVCEFTMGFDAGPLLVLLVALAAIGAVITVVLGVRRRAAALRTRDDREVEDQGFDRERPGAD